MGVVYIWYVERMVDPPPNRSGAPGAIWGTDRSHNAASVQSTSLSEGKTISEKRQCFVMRWSGEQHRQSKEMCVIDLRKEGQMCIVTVVL